MARKSFSGHAVTTVLTASISSSTLTLPVKSIVGFPDTAVGNFIVEVDRGNGSKAEKMEIVSYTTTTMTVVTGGRGADGTTAQTHTANASVSHTLDAGTITKHETFVAANGTVAPHASAVGDTTANGSSAAPAAADHKHAREAFAVGQSSNLTFGESHSDGTNASPARADHVHGMPSLPTTIPVGAIITWANTTAPNTYLFLHGQVVSGGATTYPTLAALYPTWVSGSDLHIPETRTKFVIGAGTKTPGTTGGTATVTLTVTNIPRFATVSVTITDPGHVHLTYANNTNFQAMYTDSSPATTRLALAGAASGTYVTFNPTNHVVSNTTGITAKVSLGKSLNTAITKLPPYIALNKIVRAA